MNHHHLQPKLVTCNRWGINWHCLVMEGKTWRRQMQSWWKLCSCLLQLYFWYSYAECIHLITGKLDEDVPLGEGERRRVRLFEGVQRRQQHFDWTLWRMIKLLHKFELVSCFPTSYNGFRQLLLGCSCCPPLLFPTPLSSSSPLSRQEEDSPVFIQRCQTI